MVYLSGGTVPPGCVLSGGTVPPGSIISGGTVPPFNLSLFSIEIGIHDHYLNFVHQGERGVFQKMMEDDARGGGGPRWPKKR